LWWLPFALVVTVFTLGALGPAYSSMPYAVMDRMPIWQAASATESLAVILVGCAVTVPAIVGHTVLSYCVYWAMASELTYA
jgi:cytochrome d ubiquinol oxidase subunit II